MPNAQGSNQYKKLRRPRVDNQAHISHAIPGYNAQFRAANNVDTPPDILERLADTDDPQILMALAQNGSTPSYILEQMVADIDRSSYIIVEIADHPKASASMLENLSNHSDWRVRQRVAWNPNTQGSTLTSLCADDDTWVRQTVAENPRCPSEALIGLLKDPAIDVRNIALNNPNMPDHIKAMRSLGE